MSSPEFLDRGAAYDVKPVNQFSFSRLQLKLVRTFIELSSLQTEVSVAECQQLITAKTPLETSVASASYGSPFRLLPAFAGIRY